MAPKMGVKIAAGFVFFSLLLPLYSPLQASESSLVVILQSGKRDVYQEVISGFQNSAPGSRSISFDDLQDLSSLREQIQSSSPANTAILAIGAKAASFAKREFPQLPLVFCLVFDPEKYRLSGPMITGISLQIRAQDQFSIIKQALPRLKKIGVIYNPQISGGLVAEGTEAARELGLTLVGRKVEAQKEIAQATKELIWEVDALWMIPDSTVISRESFQYLLQSTIERKIPLCSFSEGFVKGGALLALSPDYQDIGRRAGELLQKIFSGSSPGNLPVLHPSGKLILNLTAAQTLEIEIPPGILREADKIF